MRCPKCVGAELVPLEAGEIMLDRCEACAGIWFDHGELEAVVGSTAASSFEGSAPASAEVPAGPCPRCGVDMLPVVAAQDPCRPVRVDRCPSCLGLWLDRRRVQQIEDRRIPLAVRELCLGGTSDEAVVSELHEPEQELLRRTAALLCGHPRRTALLAYLERTRDRAEDE